MSQQHSVRIEVTANGNQVSKLKTYTGGARLSISETIAGSSTNAQVVGTLDVSQVVSFVMVSNVACTVKTNSTGSPADTITLVADVPYVWTSDSYDSFQLGTDVTVFYVTVPGTAASTFQIDAIYDPTP